MTTYKFIPLAGNAVWISPPCWKQIPPFEFWLNDEVCPLVSR